MVVVGAGLYYLLVGVQIVGASFLSVLFFFIYFRFT